MEGGGCGLGARDHLNTGGREHPRGQSLGWGHPAPRLSLGVGTSALPPSPWKAGVALGEGGRGPQPCPAGRPAGSHPHVRVKQGSHRLTPPPVEKGQLPVSTPPRAPTVGALLCGGLPAGGPGDPVRQKAEWVGYKPQAASLLAPDSAAAGEWGGGTGHLLLGVGDGGLYPQRGRGASTPKMSRPRTAASFWFLELRAPQGARPSQAHVGIQRPSRFPGALAERRSQWLDRVWGSHGDASVTTQTMSRQDR